MAIEDYKEEDNNVIITEKDKQDEIDDIIMKYIVYLRIILQCDAIRIKIKNNLDII